MKTSDKILLFSTLGALGLFVTVDLLHYAKYRAGEVLTYKELEAQDYDRHPMNDIHWLVLDGPMRTILRPAEHFEFDIAKEDESRFYWLRQGDTLQLFTKQRYARDAHQGWIGYFDYPPIRIYCPQLKGIRFNKGFAVLANEEGRKGLTASLTLDSTQLWVGDYYPEHDSVFQTEPWDSISVRAVNSNFVLNRQAHVKTVNLQLDGRSEASDRYSTIDTGYIKGDTGSYFHMRGKNFKKLRLDVIDH
jgi:hypothetical protein